MSKMRLAQPDLFSPSGAALSMAEDAPRWEEDPDYAAEVRDRLEAQLEQLRSTEAWPFRSITAAAQAEMRFHDQAERWLPPREGHALQVAFEVEMARLGEAVDYPIYDWKGRHRPVPVG